MMILRKALGTTTLCIAPLLVCSVFAQSKAAAPPATPQVNAKTVMMAVTVRDKHDELVPNLTKDDFTLAADGRPQTIMTFMQADTLPLTVGVLVETSVDQRAALDAERSASRQFLDTMLANARVKAFLIQFAGEVDLLADMSTEKSKLDAAVGQLGTPQFRNTGDAQSSGSGGGATLYDAIYLASSEMMKKLPERKVLIVLTDGVDRGSKESLFSTIEAAQRANTAVYAIYFKGEKQRNNNNNGFPGQRRGRTGGGYPGGGGGYPGGGGGWPGRGGNHPSRPTEGSRINGEKVLEQICNETGGHMYQVDHKHPAKQAVSTIAGALHAQYMVGFTPDKQTSGYNRVTLTAKKKDLFVQARQGYYAEE
ncbi:MAG: VWA domain-containing protein [Acidobacteriaceae bacterium]